MNYSKTKASSLVSGIPFHAICILVIFCSTAEAKKNNDTEYYFGYLELSTPSENSESCFTYPNQYYELSPAGSKSYDLVDMSDLDLCTASLNESSLPVRGPNAIFLLSARSNCSVIPSFVFVKASGAGLVLLSNHTYNMNQSYDLDIFAIVADWKKFENLNSSSHLNYTVTFFGGRTFNFSTLVLWGLAIFCIIVGSCTGIPASQLTSSTTNFITSENPEDDESEKDGARVNGEQVNFSLPLILLMVAFITITILLLYFFYKYLVYVFIAIFCLASARATFCILKQIVSASCKTDINFYKVGPFGVDEILLALLSVSIPAVWFAFRFEPLISAILQDTLGVCFCINMIQTLKIPNLKLCASLLIMLFVYDIFFVFITPFFTANGKSIMGEVATGGSGSGGDENVEQLPLLLKVPQIGRLASVCTMLGPSLLGFGDIIVPGLLTGFAYSFDVLRGNKFRPYFVSTSIGYILGLSGAFVALYLTRTGQPALLYIVPATLTFILVVGLWRKEVRALWRGSSRPQVPHVEPT